MPDTIRTLASQMVTAYIGHNQIAADEVPKLLQSLIDTLSKDVATTSVVPGHTSARMTVEESIQDDYLICFENGAKVKLLKRYLRTHFNLSPEEYIEKWNLPANYPMAAPSLSRTRRKMALSQGLGGDKA